MAALGLRVFACGRVHDVDFSRVHDGVWRHDDAIGDATLAATRALIQAHHGTAGGRANVILAPHAPDTCSDRLLTQVAALARETGLKVMIHLSQSRAENQVIRERSGGTPAELLERIGLLNDHLIAAHCIHVTPDDIARIGGAGATVAHVPKGNATGGTMAPTPALRAAGARLALGTDNLTQDMAEAMRWALIVARLQEGEVSERWQPRDVFQMATANGAAALGLGDRLGRIAAGWLADLVVFDFRRPHLAPCLDPLGTLVHDGQGRDVEHVFIDGRHVVRDGLAVLVDEVRIRADAQAVAERLWAQARAHA
jgi:5-methylthioadenosine/S-adenosylhomocysteine deaminase